MGNAKNLEIGVLQHQAAQSDQSDIDVAKLVGVLKRGRGLLVVWSLIFLALGIAYLLTATPQYEASTKIIIDPQTSQAMQKSDFSESGMIDTSMVDSQVEILSSDETARSVVRSMNLSKDPEFVGPKTGPLASIQGFIGKQIGAVSDLLGKKAKAADDPEARAVEAFSKLLTVKRTGLTYVITITMKSESPVKAAKIANTVAEAYLRGVLEAKYAATKQTGQWLEDRLAEIRTQATEADRAVEVFKGRNNIIDTNRGLLSEQQLGELNSQLALAQAATAEAKARLDRAREVAKDPLSDRTVTEALNNTVVSRLRAQYLDLSARAGDLASRFGPTHSAVTNIQRQMGEIQKSAVAQIKQIVDADESDYEVALARETSLRNSLNKLVANTDTNSIAQVKLKDLESSADSNRTLYNSYLQKFQEATQRETFPISDARIVTPAVPPLNKSSPKALIIIGGSLALGVFFGISNVVARNVMDGAFATPEDVQIETGVPLLGILPTFDVSKQASRGARWARPPVPNTAPPTFSDDSENHVLDFPYSRFTETIRNVKLSIDAVVPMRGGRLVALTSSVPGEGKTTVAINIAQLLASSGARVLLMDADLTRRSLTSRLAKAPAGGLLESLRPGATLASNVVPSSTPGLDILPCVSPDRIMGRADLLASGVFSDLLNQARANYDYILLDMAPILPVVDTKVAAHLVDCFLMVVEWRMTSRKVVLEAVSTKGVREKLLGTIVNKVDGATLKLLDAHRGKAFNGYYT